MGTRWDADWPDFPDLICRMRGSTSLVEELNFDVELFVHVLVGKFISIRKIR